MLRGAFEFQGQKCSAASRAYVAPLGVEEDARPRSSPRSTRSRWATSPTSRTSWARSSTTGPSPSTRRRSRGRSGRRTSRSSPAAQVDDSVGYFVRPTVVESTDPTDQMFTTEYFGPILAVHVFEDRDFEQVVDQMESLRAVRPDRLDHRAGPQRRRLGPRDAAVRGRQLLHQRQADRCGRRAAALRRCPGLRHQRQGRRAAEPDALDVAALHQGDVRPAEGLPLPVHGPGLTPSLAEVPEPRDHGQLRPDRHGFEARR